ncbi:CIA30 family protein [uncultured Paraglaciecola sp.]|uniref:CIA30 family protein n=1 Tax=uncultured Paraglaciecola sp. TaxID=1765024 RepID=UPI0030DC7638|tara:strand:- start:59268 stop:59894 length:627 start_codon:yes stop_codon:yes gene_type:complete
MNTQFKKISKLPSYFAIASLLAFSGLSIAAPAMPEASSTSSNAMIDNFDDPSNNTYGIPRQFFNDTVSGGNTTTELNVADGVMHLKGKIAPARGQPGWASSVLLLDPQGQPMDASEFAGIRLLVKVNAGNISISANSIEVTNFDYHTAQVPVAADGKFHEVKIPFDSMKRAWSEQTSLNTKTINGVSIVAFDLQKANFDFAVDEVSFY